MKFQQAIERMCHISGLILITSLMYCVTTFFFLRSHECFQDFLLCFPKCLLTSFTQLQYCMLLKQWRRFVCTDCDYTEIPTMPRLCNFTDLLFPNPRKLSMMPRFKAITIQNRMNYHHDHYIWTFQYSLPLTSATTPLQLHDGQRSEPNAKIPIIL